MASPLLSELCSSCHAQEPRYRCPRCKARTCSLDCYKRHQQRAACSGHRDPTSFVRRSQFATPSGVDHDFNYLRGVERRIDDTRADLTRRGIDQPSAKKNKVANRAWLPDSLLEKYLRQHDITVQHAPTGMTRQKTNLTRATKSGKVVWTVEWIDDSGVRRRQDDCLASNAVADLHRAFEVQMRNVEKRRSHPQSFPAKRRRVPSDAALVTRSHDVTPMDPRSSNPAPIEAEAEQDGTVLVQRPDGHTGLSEMHDPDISNPSDGSRTEQSLPPSSADEPSSTSQTQQTAAEQDSRFFYLHSPQSHPGNPNITILIPLLSTQTLTSALSSRTIQEYPTIYILSHSPENLPDYFALDAEQGVTAARPSSSSVEERGRRGEGVEPCPREDGVTAALTPSAILDILRRDVALYMQTGKRSD